MTINTDGPKYTRSSKIKKNSIPSDHNEAIVDNTKGAQPSKNGVQSQPTDPKMTTLRQILDSISLSCLEVEILSLSCLEVVILTAIEFSS